MRWEAPSSGYRVVVAAFRAFLLYGSLAFLTYVALSSVRSFPEGAFSLRFVLVIIVLGNIYALLLILIAVAWGGFLRAFGVTASWSDIIVVYGRTNLAKYVPGNIFQFAGRHLMGTDRRWSNQAILYSTVSEVLIIILAAAVLTFLLSTICPLKDMPGTGLVSFVVGVLVIILVLGGLTVISTWKSRPLRKFVRNINAVIYSPALPVAALLYIVFFCALGELTVATLYGIGGHWAWRLSEQFTFAYTAAWLIGYITPGAPGGVGIREAALVILLGPTLGEPVSLSVAAGLRLLTIVGDLLLFASCQYRAWFCRTST